MNRYLAYLALLFVLLHSAAVPASFADEQRTSKEDVTHADGGVDGLLVLRNGNVMRGKLVRLQEHYRVEKARSEMLIPIDQVEMICHTIDEVYQRRRQSRTGSSADSHVDLARWCLRHGLLEYAARELLDARTIDPEQRQLENVERQLQMALKNHESTQQRHSVTKVPEVPTEEELQEIENVPQWARKLFVRQIQPLVVDSCASSGCHQVGSPETFQLNRLALDGPGHPGTTLRNLSAIVKQLDLKNPAESNLLIHAREAHGSQGTLPAASLERRKYQMLLTWVEQLSIAHKNSPVDEVQLVQYEQEGAVDALPLIRQAIQQESETPEDPFDPAAFNREHDKPLP